MKHPPLQLTAGSEEAGQSNSIDEVVVDQPAPPVSGPNGGLLPPLIGDVSSLADGQLLGSADLQRTLAAQEGIDADLALALQLSLQSNGGHNRQQGQLEEEPPQLPPFLGGLSAPAGPETDNSDPESEVAQDLESVVHVLGEASPEELAHGGGTGSSQPALASAPSSGPSSGAFSSLAMARLGERGAVIPPHPALLYMVHGYE